MFAERWGEDVKWDFQQNSVIMHAPQLEFNGEIWAAFQVDDLIILIREEAIANHFAPLPFTLLSIEEARPLLGRMGLREDVRGWIIHNYFEGRDIIILNFEAICENGLKKGDLAVIKKEIIGTTAHEVRHAIQTRDRIYGPMGLWKWWKRLHGLIDQTFSRFLKTTLLRCPAAIIVTVVGGIFVLGLSAFVSFFWSVIFFFASSYEKYFWSSCERDARRYAEEAQNDNRWSEFIGVFRATDIEIAMAERIGAETKKQEGGK